MSDTRQSNDNDPQDAPAEQPESAPEMDDAALDAEAAHDGAEVQEDMAEEAGPGPEAEIAALKDRLLRTVAELDNTRKRAERDREDALKYGMTRFARDMLSVADNMRRALEAVPEDQRAGLDQSVQNLIAGVEMTERELLSIFERHDIKRVHPDPGEKFNPNYHQAMAEVPHEEHPTGAVVHIAQPGFVIGERLLRPAMVTVAKRTPLAAPPADEQKADEAGDGGDGADKPGTERGSVIDTSA